MSEINFKIVTTYEDLLAAPTRLAFFISYLMILIIDFNSGQGHLAVKRWSHTFMNKTLDRWIVILRISIGIIYLWFGLLKFFPGVSPAEELAKETIHLLTFGVIKSEISLLLLAIWETAIGLFLMSGYYTRFVIKFVVAHMICTFTPLFLLPTNSFTSAPLALTLVGQYIIKNIVIVSALFVIDSARVKS